MDKKPWRSCAVCIVKEDLLIAVCACTHMPGAPEKPTSVCSAISPLSLTHTVRQAWPKHTGTLSSLLAIQRLKASLCVLSAHLLKVQCSRFHLNIKSFLVTIKLAPCMPLPPEDVFFSHLFPVFEWCKIHLSLKSRWIDIAVTLLLWLFFEAPVSSEAWVHIPPLPPNVN